jgi:hypothetical protein
MYVFLSHYAFGWEEPVTGIEEQPAELVTAFNGNTILAFVLQVRPKK